MTRWIAVAAVVTFSSYAVYCLAWQPFRCDIMKGRVQRAAINDWDRPKTLRMAAEARERIAVMEQCIASSPTDIDMYMTLAANDRLIGRFEHAAAMYLEALRYSRRPELFFNLGMVQLEMKQRQTAVMSLTNAVMFEINYANDIPDPTVREEVLAAVKTIRAKSIRQ